MTWGDEDRAKCKNVEKKWKMRRKNVCCLKKSKNGVVEKWSEGRGGYVEVFGKKEEIVK